MKPPAKRRGDDENASENSKKSGSEPPPKKRKKARSDKVLEVACVVCEEVKPMGQFSKTQWKKKPADCRKCKVCTGLAVKKTQFKLDNGAGAGPGGRNGKKALETASKQEYDMTAVD